MSFLPERLPDPFGDWVQVYHTTRTYVNLVDGRVQRTYPSYDDGSRQYSKALGMKRSWQQPDFTRTLHETGYVIVHDVISDDLCSAIVESGKSFSSKEWRTDFGRDAFREGRREKQTGRFSMDFTLSKLTQRAKSKTLGILRGFGCLTKDHRVTTITLLKSRNAPSQAEHIDYDYDQTFERSQNADGSVPYPLSVLVAVQDGTKFVLHDGTEVDVPRRGIILFRGDYPHCGAAYASEHFRLHMYIACGSVDVPKSSDGSTYVVPEACSYFRYNTSCAKETMV